MTRLPRDTAEMQTDLAALQTHLGKVGQSTIAELTSNQRFAEFFKKPDNMEAAVAQLKEDLSDVPVVGAGGQVTDPYHKIESDTSISQADKNLIWNCMAIVRESFYRADGQNAGRGSGGYQTNMNWKHTRAEIDQVWEASRLLNLDAEGAADAILASIFSDSVKNRKNFITHNIDGAYGAAQVLLNFLDPTQPAQLQRIGRIAQAVREHQIAPPEFMARFTAIMLSKKLKLGAFDPETIVGEPGADDSAEQRHRKLVASIYRKISDPLNRDNLVEDLHRIRFTAEEHAILKELNIDEWYVPHPQNLDARLAHAVIAGDHSINYNHPEGFAKIALIRGPDSESIFEDPTILHSLDSAVSSFVDSFRVLMYEVHPMSITGLRRTKSAVERVTAIMRELFSGVVVGPKDTSTTGVEKLSVAIKRAHEKSPELFIVSRRESYHACKRVTERAVDRVAKNLQEWLDEYGEIPFNVKDSSPSEPGPAKLPFWNAPLKYPERDGNGAMNMDSLTELQRRQFLFAIKIRDIAVELLRAEQWIY
jgi:hypothetical protein